MTAWVLNCVALGLLASMQIVAWRRRMDLAISLDGAHKRIDLLIERLALLTRR